MMGIRRIAAGAVALVVVGSLGVTTLALGQTDTVGATTVKTRRVSVATDGSQLGRASDSPRLSTNGRFVAFASKSPRLVAGDDNKSTDVFVRDRLTRTTEMVSVSSTGALGNAPSFPNAISGDGRFVVFTSAASTFVEDDVEPGLEEALDVFLHDRQTGVTERISVNSDGEAALGPSFDSAVSDDGRFVAFESGAANLAGNDGDDTFDIFVRDRELETTDPTPTTL
jgi:Tol biopolymer transport system component